MQTHPTPRATQTVREAVLKEAATASLSVKRLILMQAGEADTQIVPSLGLSLDDLAQLFSDIALFHELRWQDGKKANRENRMDLVLEETSDSDLAIACDFLSRLAFESKPVIKLFSQAIEDRAVSAAWHDLTTNCVGSVHDVFLSENECSQSELEELLRAKFLASKQLNLLKWLDRTLARRGGFVALSSIVDLQKFLQPF